MAKYITNDFYCIQCGQKGLPVQRKQGKARGVFHRKKLWCCNCKVEINHVEVRNDYERDCFKEMYENGDFRTEAEDSLRACGNPLGRTY